MTDTLRNGDVFRFNKVYIEISSVCNLKCSFCHGTKRAKTFMSVSDFSVAAKKVRKLTSYIYLHVLGEPLLHPELSDILSVCKELNFHTCITTNGVLINEKGEMLLSYSPYKISFSLHSYEANDMPVTVSDYVGNICSFVQKAQKKGVLCSLRLWNGGGKNSRNKEIMEIIREYFPYEFTKTINGYKIADRVYIEYADMFSWPDIKGDKKNVRFCRGLRDQIGVLCDGTVVPCCLDCEGDIPLGNIFEEELSDILNSPRAQSIYNGFSEGKPSERLCRRCGYAEKF